MNRPSLALIVLLLNTAATAGNPELRDFATGFDLEIKAGLPAQELVLPDAIYATTTRADLGDLRVFNGAGIVAPHALCAGPAPAADTVHEQPLPVFALQGGKPMPLGGTRVDVQTSSGTAVQIQEPAPTGAPDSSAAISAYVVDAHELADPIRALKLSWSTDDGASEVPVRVETSDNLDQWRTVVERTMLLRSAAEGRVLERIRIELPTGNYRYLRLERSDSGPPPRIDQVTAELQVAAVEATPFWFAAAPLERPAEHEYVFETGRRAPVHAALVKLPADNMALRIKLDSRVTPEAQWQARWQGEVLSVAGENGVRQEQSIRFAQTADREWRLRILRGAETLGTARPALELAYHPARLRFLVQGSAPYLLAFGSARVPPAEVATCDSLLGSLPSDERARLIGTAVAAPAPVARFGGIEALTPAPKPTPVRLIILWSVLIAGTVLLVALAINLMRRLQNPASN